MAITYANPTRMIRLSLVADAESENPCATTLSRIKGIRRALSRAGLPPGEWSYTIERNPKGTGYHAHCLQLGRFIPQRRLQDACKAAGAGIPFINAITEGYRWGSRYGLKGFGAFGYGMKTIAADGDPVDALRINNGRVEHHSRRFFAVNGKPLPIREYESLAVRAMNGDKPLAFIGATPAGAAELLADDHLRNELIRRIWRDQDHAEAVRA